MKLNLNSNFISTLLGVIIGSFLTIGVNLYFENRTDIKKEEKALIILSIEFEKIKNAAPGLSNSFNNALDIMICDKSPQLPFNIGSFTLLKQDLLSLRIDDYRKLYKEVV